MSELADKMFECADRLEVIGKESESPNLTEPLCKLRDAANKIGRASSGSWMGYHSRVYYDGLQPPPPGANFSVEWGMKHFWSGDHGSIGEWAEYTFEGVYGAIFSMAGLESLTQFDEMISRAKTAFADAREEFLSIATVSLENKSDAFLSRLKAQVEEMKIAGKYSYANAVQPNVKVITYDTLAAGQGFQAPPHIVVLSEVYSVEDAPKKCAELAKVLRRAASHLDTRERHKHEKRTVGTNVFFGHGRSVVWKDLKDFIQDRMGLPWDEFNRVPIAGTTNISRLSQMLDEAAIAFMVMTAEDEQLDGTVRARENVIHEAGLFQGKLGFTKAIILLEEGCEEFSNIHGLGQIRFPKGNIKAAFEEIRLVLEREKIIES